MLAEGEQMASDRESFGGSRTCPNCGQAVAGDDRFCPSCGSATVPTSGSVFADVYSPVRLTIDYEYGEPLSAYRLVVNRLLLFVK